MQTRPGSEHVVAYGLLLFAWQCFGLSARCFYLSLEGVSVIRIIVHMLTGVEMLVTIFSKYFDHFRVQKNMILYMRNCLCSIRSARDGESKQYIKSRYDREKMLTLNTAKACSQVFVQVSCL